MKIEIQFIKIFQLQEFVADEFDPLLHLCNSGVIGEKKLLLGTVDQGLWWRLIVFIRWLGLCQGGQGSVAEGYRGIMHGFIDILAGFIEMFSQPK